ncbi:MAG: hypothetical protein MJZ07_02130 [Bacteroidales bacterium]|nr:hypothetical protein [Bacteroidales bacterium]
MKKFLAFISFALLSCAAALAQPRAVGGYAGFLNQGVYYQHFTKENQFVNITVSNDLTNFTSNGETFGLMIGADYNFIITSFPKSKGSFNLTGGPGLYIGHGAATVPRDRDGLASFVSIGGNFGFDFTFDCHVQLFARLAPKVGICIGVTKDEEGNKIYTPGLEYGRILYGFIPEFGVAYSF